MWKPEHRLANGRRGLRYPSDLSDAEWVLLRSFRRPGAADGGGRSTSDHRLPERQGGPKGGSSLAPQGFDAGKKVTGRKRHILVDTLGLLLGVSVLLPTFKTATVPAICCSERGGAFLSSNVFSRTRAIRGRKWQRLPPRQARGTSKLSSDLISTALSFCQSDGSSSGHSPGSAAIAV